MIINCPECSTGFKLPDERITPKGTKLKCSRCDHVFRVREGDDGDPEIFYRPHDNKDDDAGEAKKSGKSSPFPHSGGLGGLKPKKKSAFGAVSGDEGEEEFELTEESEPEVMEVQEEESDGEDVETLNASGASDFGDPSEHVDPSFGEDGPYFDPEEGKVETSAAPPKKKRGSGPPPGAAAAGPPPTAKKLAAADLGAPQSDSSAPDPKPAAAAPSPTPAPAPVDWDEDDLAPHNIGGGMGSKVVTVLFLLSLVAFGFFGALAYLNDGFIDFKSFDQMLEVAFSDGEYEPREEWSAQGPATIVVGPEEPVSVESAYGELVTTAGGDQIFVVRGLIRNNEDSRVRDVELRSMISSPEGHSLREIAGGAGDDIPVGEFRQLSDLDELRELFGSGEVTIEPGRAEAFTLVFQDVPSRVREGESFAFRVEVINQDGGAGSVAAQE